MSKAFRYIFGYIDVGDGWFWWQVWDACFSPFSRHQQHCSHRSYHKVKIFVETNLIFSCWKSLREFHQFSFLIINFGFSHSLFSLLCFQSKIFFEFFFAIRIRAFCCSNQRFFWSMMNFLWLKKWLKSFEMVLVI